MEKVKGCEYFLMALDVCVVSSHLADVLVQSYCLLAHQTHSSKATVSHCVPYYWLVSIYEDQVDSFQLLHLYPMACGRLAGRKT